MGWPWLDRLFGTAEATPVRRVHIPIKHEVVEALKPSLIHVHTWQCGCGAQLRIRARDPHDDGPSNFVPYPTGHHKAGQSKLPPLLLTWDGLAVERGWKVDPEIVCPACQAGMTVDEYKAYRRGRDQAQATIARS